MMCSNIFGYMFQDNSKIIDFSDLQGVDGAKKFLSKHKSFSPLSHLKKILKYRCVIFSHLL